MTDQIANGLAHATLDLEARRNALKTQYYEPTILPARTAARVASQGTASLRSPAETRLQFTLNAAATVQP